MKRPAFELEEDDDEPFLFSAGDEEKSDDALVELYARFGLSNQNQSVSNVLCQVIDIGKCAPITGGVSSGFVPLQGS